MKTKLYFLIMLSMSFNKSSFAQCIYDNTLFLTGPAPTVIGNSIVGPQTWGGDFNRVTGMQAGFTYEISTCGTPTFDSEITIYPAGGGTPVAYDDDGCGTTGGSSKITFVPPVTGDYDILLDEFPCASNQVDMDMIITLISTTVSGNNLLRIPVVVHVVSKNATENISDLQILTQINALNADFRKLNLDFSQVPSAYQGLGADLNIEFCLAMIDPNGAMSNGITRTSTSMPFFSPNAEPKSSVSGGHDNWDPEHYLNIWVCDLTPGLLGYATFPTDLATNPQLDGVVISYKYFGTGTIAPFDLGRIATHEIGHWLNLKHIWGDANCGNDQVFDTPTQETSNGGCPIFPHVTCSNGPNGDLFMNYMDYTDDACMMMFTQGQKQRVDAGIALFRSGLANSNGCGQATGIKYISDQPSVELFPNPASESVTIKINGSSNLKYAIKVRNTLGEVLMEASNAFADSGQLTLSVNDLPKGIYLIEVISTEAKLVKKLVVQ